MREEREKELARLIAEALQEEAESVPVPPPEAAWAKIRPRLTAGLRVRRFRWQLLPAVGVAAALVLVFGSLLLAGPAGLNWLQPRSDRMLAAGSSPTEARLRAPAPPSVEQEVAPGDKPPGTAAAPPAPAEDRQSPAFAGPQKSRTPEGAGGTVRVTASAAASPREEGSLPAGLADAGPTPGQTVTLPQPAAQRAEGAVAVRVPASTPTRDGRETLRPGRNGSQVRFSREYASLEEVRPLVPFPLPRPAFLPLPLQFAAVTLERTDEEHAVASLIYKEAGGAYLRLRVSNISPPQEKTVPQPGEAVRAVLLRDAVGLLRLREDRVLLQWRKDGLYLELETNLAAAQAVEVGQSLAWGQ